mgnify:CR=1 FL=1
MVYTTDRKPLLCNHKQIFNRVIEEVYSLTDSNMNHYESIYKLTYLFSFILYFYKNVIFNYSKISYEFIIINNNIYEIIKNKLPEEWDIVLLGYNGKDKSLEQDILRIEKQHFGFFGYIINKQGAKNLLKRCFPVKFNLSLILSILFLTNKS